VATGSSGIPFALVIDHVQGDAFAAPSRMHAVIPSKAAGFPEVVASSPARRRALCDYLARCIAKFAGHNGLDRVMDSGGGGWHGAKGGDLKIDAPGQQTLERTAVQLLPSGDVEVRFTLGLPARGRSICGNYAAEVLCSGLPSAIASSVPWAIHD